MKKRIFLMSFFLFSLLYSDNGNLNEISLPEEGNSVTILQTVKFDDQTIYISGFRETNVTGKPVAFVYRYDYQHVEKIWEYSSRKSGAYTIPAVRVLDTNKDGNPEIMLLLNYLHDNKSKKLPWLFYFDAADENFPKKPTFTWDYNLSGISYLRPVDMTTGNYDLDPQVEFCFVSGAPDRSIFLADYSPEDPDAPFSFIKKLDFPEIITGLGPIRVLTIKSRTDAPDEILVAGEKNELLLLKYSPISSQKEIYRYPDLPAGSADITSLQTGQLIESRQPEIAGITSHEKLFVLSMQPKSKSIFPEIADLPLVKDVLIYRENPLEEDYLLVCSSDKSQLLNVFRDPQSTAENPVFFAQPIGESNLLQGTIRNISTATTADGELTSLIFLQMINSAEKTRFYLLDKGWKKDVLEEILTTTRGADFDANIVEETTLFEKPEEQLAELSSFKGDLYEVRETSEKTIFSAASKARPKPDRVIKPGEKLKISVPVKELNLSEYTNVNIKKKFPLGMKFDPLSGFLTWTPADTQLGFYYPRLEFYLDSLQSNFSYVIYVNDPPKIISTPPTSRIIQIGDTFNYQIEVVDNNPDRQHTFSLRRAPEGAKLDDTGKFTWTPSQDQVDWYEIVIQVSDSYHTDSQSFDLFVNHPVRITSKGPDYCLLGNTYEYQPVIEDKNQGFYIQFGKNIPKIIDGSKTRIYEISFTDQEISDNLHKYIEVFRKSDSPYLLDSENQNKISRNLALIDLFAHEKRLILVTREESGTKSSPHNWVKTIFQPQLGKLPEFKSREIKLYRFESVNLPRGAKQYPDGKIVWKPDPDQFDTYPVIYTVSDGYTQDSENIQIYVNSPPVITSRPDSIASIGVFWSYQVEVRDNNTDSQISFTLSESPEGMLIDRSGLVTWIPESDQIGNFRFKVKASDGYESDLQVATIFVNVPPKFTSEAQPVAVMGFTYNYKVTAIDPNGDAVILEAVQIPETARFDPSTGNFTWLPDENSLGQNTLIFKATDKYGASAQQDIILQVFENPAPKPKGKFGSFFVISFIGAISLALGIALGSLII